VGIGQSDVAVTDLVDLTLLLVPPGGGDDLQGIKRGVMEHADVVVVTKADGDLAATARHTASDYRHALHLLRGASSWEPPVVTCSAAAGEGIDEVWAEVQRWKEHADADGSLTAERSRQAVAALWAEVRAEVEQQVRAAAQDDDVVAALELDVAAGRVTPHQAAAQLLARTVSRGTS
jgi:LAO/AO transport system kinase